MKNGLLIFSAPSGSGKSTIVQWLMKEHPEFNLFKTLRQNIIKGLEQIPSVDYDKNRLEQELIYYIEKLDISEEKQGLS